MIELIPDYLPQRGETNIGSTTLKWFMDNVVLIKLLLSEMKV